MMESKTLLVLNARRLSNGGIVNLSEAFCEIAVWRTVQRILPNAVPVPVARGAFNIAGMVLSYPCFVTFYVARTLATTSPLSSLLDDRI